ncbi:hypothetical protein BJY01DRAFT_223618 [Aspergillus pseudoustus]|uniref:Uncharacterized protein n=1 Tax=Aspergillus pseudoustus TaxID=1810923 RepID=A0ABR4J657_9EURO
MEPTSSPGRTHVKSGLTCLLGYPLDNHALFLRDMCFPRLGCWPIVLRPITQCPRGLVFFAVVHTSSPGSFALSLLPTTP